jgi:hypothetical protein
VENQVELDIDIAHFTAKLALTIRKFSSNVKNNQGTEGWDTLLLESGDFRGISTV